MSGAISTLAAMLRDTPSMADVSLIVGEEFRTAAEFPLPFVALVPQGGPWSEPGYVGDLDPLIEALWSTRETIECHLWAAADDAEAEPLAHYDAVEELRARVLRAFQTQRAPGGLFFKPISGRWERMTDGIVRLGRGYVLNIEIEIAVTTIPPDEVDQSTLTVNIA